jgi:clan AA aspartic protease (TIGR02281 family)
MPQLFTIRWPLLARLDAVLLFPLAFMLAGETSIVASIVNPGLGPAFGLFAARYGLPPLAGYWAAFAVVTILPYIVLLTVIDRVLTVRKGYAYLSALAVIAFARTGLLASDWISSIAPTSFTAPGEGPSFEWTIALAAGTFALLLHIKPLMMGILDDGRVAERLLALSGDSPTLIWGDRTARKASRVLSRADQPNLRAWFGGELDLTPRDARRSPVTTALYAVTWSAVVGSVVFAWSIWNARDQDQASQGILGGPRSFARLEMPTIRPRQPTPDVPPQRAANMGMSGATLHQITQGPLQTQSQVTMPPVAGQRQPAPMPAVVGPSVSLPASNEAVAERARDGGFVFSGEINGVTASMVFDTGATVVGLRAEDAIRMGYVLEKLNFSAKVKTANGTADVAPVIIGTITIGNITQRNVVGFVARPGMLHENLLGQTFLTRLAGFGVEGNRLVLKGR